MTIFVIASVAKQSSENTWVITIELIQQILSEDPNKQLVAVKQLDKQLAAVQKFQNQDVADSLYYHAILLMGLCYFDGIGIQQDFKKAYALFKEIEEKSSFVKFYLGMMHEKGLGVLMDPKVALAFYQAAAKQGDVNALYELGKHYLAGQYITKNSEAAFKLCFHAAKMGLVDAEYTLGWMYDEGIGVVRDLEQALKFYQIAAKKGHPDAQYSLVLMYEEGRGVDQDFNKAAELCQAVVDQGINVEIYATVLAHDKLGQMYEEGRGVEQDLKQAAKLYQAAADHDNDDAQCNLGLMYEEGQGVKEDLEKAAQLYQAAADQDNDRAQYQLGILYEEGRGVEQDLKKAAQLYLAAAVRGNGDAQCDLGLMYEEGRGVFKDYWKAIELYEKAACGGIPRAAHYLAILYCRFPLIQSESRFPRPSLLLSVCPVDEFSRKQNQNFLPALMPAPIVRQIVEQCQRNAATGDPIAQGNLGFCYKFGIYVEQDLAMAVKLFRQAAEVEFSYLYDLWSCYKVNSEVVGEQHIDWLKEKCELIVLKNNPAGKPIALLILGEIFERGAREAQSLKTAYFYYNESQQANVASLFDNGETVIDNNFINEKVACTYFLPFYTRVVLSTCALSQNTASLIARICLLTQYS